MKYIFLPGMLCDERLWKSQIEHLINSGVSEDNIVIADLTLDNSIAAMAHRLLQTISEETVVIAFSLGTQVALEMMSTNPDHIKKLCLISGACGELSPELKNALKEAMQFASNNFDAYLENAFPKYLATGGLNYVYTKKLFFEMAQSLGKEVCIRQLHALLTSSITKDALKNIHCPTLIIGGCLDRRTTPIVQKELNHMIRNSTLELIENSEHFVTLQAPEEVNVILTNWVN